MALSAWKMAPLLQSKNCALLSTHPQNTNSMSLHVRIYVSLLLFKKYLTINKLEKRLCVAAQFCHLFHDRQQKWDVTQCLKVVQILAFSTNFCPIKTNLSGNTIWPQASGFQKLAKMDHFWHFWLTFVHSKCKRSFARNIEWDFSCDFQTPCIGDTLFVSKSLRLCWQLIVWNLTMRKSLSKWCLRFFLKWLEGPKHCYSEQRRKVLWFNCSHEK